MKWYLSLLGALAVWRLTHLLHAQAGPRRILETLRRWAGESSSLACFYCLSLWVSVPVALVIGQDWLEQVLLWLALSTTAIALDLLLDLISRSTAPPAHLQLLTPSQMAQAMAARFFDEPHADEPAEPLFTPTRTRTH
jgi:hypothetical protein